MDPSYFAPIIESPARPDPPPLPRERHPNHDLQADQPLTFPSLIEMLEADQGPVPDFGGPGMHFSPPLAYLSSMSGRVALLRTNLSCALADAESLQDGTNVDASNTITRLVRTIRDTRSLLNTTFTDPVNDILANRPTNRWDPTTRDLSMEYREWASSLHREISRSAPNVASTDASTISLDDMVARIRVSGRADVELLNRCVGNRLSEVVWGEIQDGMHSSGGSADAADTQGASDGQRLVTGEFAAQFLGFRPNSHNGRQSELG